MKIEDVSLLQEKLSRSLESCRAIEFALRCNTAELDKRNLQALNKALAYAAKNSPFYAKRFAAEGGVKSINELSEMAQFSFTTKYDLRKAYPLGMLAVPQAKLVRYGESTGTTGTPSSSFMTRNDWLRDNWWATLSYANFMSSEDMIFIAVPYELAFAAAATEMALWNIGVTVVAVGALNKICPWERTLRMMRELHPSILMCTPTRALRLFDMCLAKGYDPLKIGLKTIFYVGETCSEAKLNKIADLWGAKLLTAYGATETNSLSLPCARGQQHLVEDRFYFEVVDPETGKVVEGKTKSGELVITSLFSEALPLLRYRTGDIVRVDEGSCECGLPFRRMKHFGRYTEKVSVGGRSILKIDLEQNILAVAGTGCYYAVEVDGENLIVAVNVVGRDRQKVIGEVRDRIYDSYGIKALVDVKNKEVFCAAMDNMLKPGSLAMRHLKNDGR